MPREELAVCQGSFWVSHKGMHLSLRTVVGAVIPGPRVKTTESKRGDLLRSGLFFTGTDPSNPHDSERGCLLPVAQTGDRS